MAATASEIASWPQDVREEFLAGLSEDEALVFLYDWQNWARPEQLPPSGDWRTWLILAGRGWGKSRTGAETVQSWIESGRCKRLALVAPTAADVRDVMVEGESGILSVAPPWNTPEYEPSKRRLTWPNGAIGTLFTADKPDRLRGPQHDGAWCDEIGSWRYPEAWDMLQFGLRLGDDPRAIVTTTPRPIPIILELVKAKTTAITRGSTYDNRANLAPAFLQQIVSKYEGTRLGRQELHAELLTDTPGALWNRDMLEENRVRSAPELVRVIVGVDPATTATKESDETGIIVAGKDAKGHGFVIDDVSLVGSPDRWARVAVDAYHRNKADRIVAEVNQGGDMVMHTIKTVDRKAAYKAVRATRGKFIRAEPVAALYEQGKVHHVGTLGKLEDQLCTWTPGEDSPDRLDALVWALTEVLVTGTATAEIF